MYDGGSLLYPADTLAAQDNILFLTSRLGNISSQETTTYVTNVVVPYKTQNASGFDCVQCGKMYRQKYNLLSHIRFDCGKEPQFACLICKSRFTRVSSLRRHMKEKSHNFNIIQCHV